LEEFGIKQGRVEEAFRRRPGIMQGCRANDDDDDDEDQEWDWTSGRTADWQCLS
jgi:hypothetical protein